MVSDGARESAVVRPLEVPELAPEPGYSHVVEVNPGARLLWIAGQVALDKEGRVVGEGDLAAQTRQVFRNLEAALAAGSAGWADVVKLSWFVLDAREVATIRSVRDEFVDTAAPPASTLVEVRSLFRPELLIEVEAIAAVQP
jgi:enamine deaminase RidA (YjgF/YER057c/UK114 family)